MRKTMSLVSSDSVKALTFSYSSIFGRHLSVKGTTRHSESQVNRMAEFGESLSKRECEVLELVATGATNRQIADVLVVSINTVKVHLRNIFTKLGVESRTEATLTAIREGLVVVPTIEPDEPNADSILTETQISSAQPVEGAIDGLASSVPVERLPPLPWPKRVAFVVGLVLVTLMSVATWPRPQTVADRFSDDTDGLVVNSAIGGVPGESTGWRAVAPMTVPRSRFALVVKPNGDLVAIGGETIGGITGAVESYDPAMDLWTPVTASKPTRVSNISAASIGEWIYVPGGWTAEGQPTAVVEAYNLTDETWREFSSLPRPLSGYALVVLEERVYVFGGKDDRGYTSTTFVYDPEENEWQEGKPMPTRRAFAAAAALGSHIYVIGGYDGQRELSACEVYYPQDDAWDTCEPLTLARGGLGAAGVANRLYVVGGGRSSNLWFSEAYYPGSGTWTPFQTPVMSRQWINLAVASTPVKFYAAGGWNGNYLNSVWKYEVLSHTIFIPAASP
jgi:DNA-binding CsgD family transcriptional regulator/N-acetylneuraminic acid mutarotase